MVFFFLLFLRYYFVNKRERMREICYINYFMILEIIIGKNIYCEMGFLLEKIKRN